MQDGLWMLDDGGDPIEYKGSEYQRMSFYAYYPYDENVIFEPAKTDPFETYISNWKIGENNETSDGTCCNTDAGAGLQFYEWKYR